MAIKRINISKLLTTAKQIQQAQEDDIPRIWTKRELVDLMVLVIESLKKK